MDALKIIVQLGVYFEKRSTCASHISMVYSRPAAETNWYPWRTVWRSHSNSCQHPTLSENMQLFPQVAAESIDVPWDADYGPA